MNNIATTELRTRRQGAYARSCGLPFQHNASPAWRSGWMEEDTRVFSEEDERAEYGEYVTEGAYE